MKITLSGQNSIFQASMAINQKLEKNAVQNGNQEDASSSIRMDSVLLSRQGKKQSLIQQLMTQKQLIQENKNSLIKNGAEDGQIDKNKLEEYEKQLEMIDEQIAQAMADEATENSENDDNSDSKKEMTKEEYEAQKMTDMISISTGMEKAQGMMSTKDRLDQEAAIKESELENDQYLSGSPQWKLERIAEIKSRSAKLMEEAGENMSETLEIIDRQQQIQIVDEEEDEARSDTEDIIRQMLEEEE